MFFGWSIVGAISYTVKVKRYLTKQIPFSLKLKQSNVYNTLQSIVKDLRFENIS